MFAFLSREMEIVVDLSEVLWEVTPREEVLPVQLTPSCPLSAFDSLCLFVSLPFPPGAWHT